MSMLTFKSSLMNLELNLIFTGVSHVALNMMSRVHMVMAPGDFAIEQHERY